VHPVAFRNPFDRTSQPPHIVALIPARYDSTRFPGKPLAELGGRPMIEHVYRRAAAAASVDAVVVATDDARIVSVVERFGGFARLTRSSHRSGTDRLAEVAEDLPCDIVVNVQGDEPLVDPLTIEELVGPLDADPLLNMSTIRRRITDPDDYTNPNVVKVVVDADGNALYFSRAPVPFIRGSDDPERRVERGPEDLQRAVVYKHIGLYAYRRSFLLAFARLQPTPLELAESLEQLRALEHGFRIRTVETEHDSIGVDTPEDLERARHVLGSAART
jgi:3-deoxy-manno-octulosonate cytidylyltransferase (CMP-KDO synthetase)